MSAAEFHRLGSPSPDLVALAQRFEVGKQLHPVLGGERRCTTDHLQFTVVAVQTEQDRADTFAALVDAVADGHAVGVAGMLDLDHLALARQVRPVEPLGDHAVEARTLERGQPLRALLGVLGGAGDVAPLLFVHR